MENQCGVTVVDCIPGTGKTSWAIDYMNTNTNKNLFILHHI